MRTTLIIPDSIYARAKKKAGQLHKSVSDLTAEAIELYLLKTDHAASSKKRTFNIKSFSMGKAKVDLSDREALYRAMDK